MQKQNKQKSQRNLSQTQSTRSNSTNNNRTQKYKDIKSRYKEPKKFIGTNFDLNRSSGKLAVLPNSTLKIIFQFSISNFGDIINYKSICWRFFSILQELECFQFINPLKHQNLSDLMQELRIKYFNRLILKYNEFDQKMNSLFQYGSTKLNLPDKLLEQLNLQCRLQINKKNYEPKILFRKLNFASHIYFKQMLDQIPCNMKQDTYDSISINIRIYSQYLDLYKDYIIKFECQDILKQSTTQKAFTYMTDGNYLFTYFENDKSMLYLLFENSSVDLMHYFQQRIQNKHFWLIKNQIKNQFQKLPKQQIQIQQEKQDNQQINSEDDSEDEQHIPFQQQQLQQPKQQQQLILPQINQGPNIPRPKLKTQTKVSTFLKTKVLKTTYTSMKDYMQDQQDFELMINIHTGIQGQSVLYFIDTKASPKLDMNHLYFTYQAKEKINLTYKLHLDNKMGIKEPVDNLYLCDVTFKDRDQFRILFSGFVRMYDEDINTVSKDYNVSFLDNKAWKSLKLKNNFDLTILFGTQPTKLKLIELKLSKNIFY